LFCKNAPDFKKLNNDLRKLGFEKISMGNFHQYEDIDKQINEVLEFVDNHVTCMNTLNVKKN